LKSQQKILENVENSCDPSHVRIIKQNKVKLEIFAKYFFGHFVKKFEKSAKNLKKCRKFM